MIDTRKMSDVYDKTDFIFSATASRITTVNGSLSAVSSMLIMSIILRSSPESRFSVHHIIMFLMNFWDTVLSIAMALTTAPMPSDVHEVYPFAGNAYGNIGTCEAQGFTITTGAFLSFGAYTTLNAYYVCTLRFGMAEEKFKRRILPAMLAISVTGSILLTTSFLKMGYFNPSPLRGYCVFNVAYSNGCNDARDESEGGSHNSNCTRGAESIAYTYVDLVALIFFGGTFLVLVCSMTLIVVKTFRAELVIRSGRRFRRRGANRRMIDSRATARVDEFRRTRAILTQALMYISAFLLTWIWTFIYGGRMQAYSFERGPSNTLAFFTVFFTPLHGFFNATIFIYQKVHTLCQTNASLKFHQGFKQVILSPSTVPQTLVSQFDILEEDAEIRREGGHHRAHRRQNSSSSQRQILGNVSGLRLSGSGEEAGDNDATPGSMISRLGPDSSDASQPPSSIISGLNSMSLGQSDVELPPSDNSGLDSFPLGLPDANPVGINDDETGTASLTTCTFDPE